MNPKLWPNFVHPKPDFSEILVIRALVKFSVWEKFGYNKFLFQNDSKCPKKRCALLSLSTEPKLRHRIKNLVLLCYKNALKTWKTPKNGYLVLRVFKIFNIIRTFEVLVKNETKIFCMGIFQGHHSRPANFTFFTKKRHFLAQIRSFH